MSVATAFPHIVLDARGQARIEGTRIKVKHLVAERMAHGWSPDEVVFQHLGLTLAQVYSALAYYEENRAAIDEEIERDLAGADPSCRALSESPLSLRLRALRSK